MANIVTSDNLGDSLEVVNGELHVKVDNSSVVKGAGGELVAPNFSILICDQNEGLISETGVSFQPEVQGSYSGPITWEIVSSSGDMVNFAIDSQTAVVTYDIVNLFSNNGKGEVVISATDSNGLKVYHKVCLKAADPYEEETLACNGDLESNSPDIVNQLLLFAKADPSRVFQDLGKTIPSGDGDVVNVLEDSTGAGDLVANNTSPIYVASDAQFSNNPVVDFTSGNKSLEYQVPSSPVAGSNFTITALLTAGGNDSNATVISSTLVSNNNQTSDPRTWQISRMGSEDNFGFRIGTGNSWTNIVMGSQGTAVHDINSTVSWGEFTDGQPKLLHVYYDNPTVYMYINGELVLQADVAVNPSLVGEYLKIFENRGNSSFTDGKLAEIIFASGSITQVDQTRMQSYFLCKYDLDSSLIADPGPFSVEDRFYEKISQFQRQTYSDGSVRIYDTLNGVYYDTEDVPTPGLGVLRTSYVDTIASIPKSIAQSMLGAAIVSIPAPSSSLVLASVSLEAGKFYKISYTVRLSSSLATGGSASVGCKLGTAVLGSSSVYLQGVGQEEQVFGDLIFNSLTEQVVDLYIQNNNISGNILNDINGETKILAVEL